MKADLHYALGELREETVRLCSRIRQSRIIVPLIDDDFGRASPSDPLVTAEPQAREIEPGNRIYPVRQTTLSIATVQPRHESTNAHQVGSDEAVIPHPKPTSARHVLLLVLLPIVVITLAITVQMQSEIRQLVDLAIPILDNVTTHSETLIREFWAKL